MFKNWKVVNVFKYFSKENLKKHEAYTQDKDIYLSIGSSAILLLIILVPMLLLTGKLDQVIQSSSTFLAGMITFCLMYFAFKTPKKK